MVTSFKRSHVGTATLSARPCSRSLRPTLPLETPEHTWASLGHSLAESLLLSPGSWCAQGSVCTLQASIPQSCVSSGRSMVGLMATSSKRAYAIPRSAAQSPCSRPLLTCPSTGDTQTLKGRSGSLSVESPGMHRFCLSPLSISGRYGV